MNLHFYFLCLLLIHIHGAAVAAASATTTTTTTNPSKRPIFLPLPLPLPTSDTTQSHQPIHAPSHQTITSSDLLTTTTSPNPSHKPSSVTSVHASNPSHHLFISTPASHNQNHSKHQICSFPSARDRFYYVEYIRFGLFIATSSTNWFLLVRYVTDNIKQSYTYLISYLVAYATVFLIPSRHYTRWETIKLLSNVGVYLIGCILDLVSYSEFEHWKAIVPFTGLSAAANFVVRYHHGDRKRMKQVIDIIGRVAPLTSVLVSILGILCCKLEWDFVVFEVYNSLLNLIYLLCGFIDACNTLDMVLVSLSIAAQFVYTIALVAYLVKKKVLDCKCLSFFTSGIQHATHRHFRSFKEMGQKFISCFCRRNTAQQV